MQFFHPKSLNVLLKIEWAFWLQRIAVFSFPQFVPLRFCELADDCFLLNQKSVELIHFKVRE